MAVKFPSQPFFEFPSIFLQFSYYNSSYDAIIIS